MQVAVVVDKIIIQELVEALVAMVAVELAEEHLLLLQEQLTQEVAVVADQELEL
jgi:hypothetical protein